VAHRIPSWPINAIGTPELHELNKRRRACQASDLIFQKVLRRRHVSANRNQIQPLLAAMRSSTPRARLRRPVPVARVAPV